MPPPEPQPPTHSADCLDDALEALWQGDSRPLDNLLTSDGAPGPSVGRIIEGAIDEAAEVTRSASAMAEVPGYEIIEEIGQGGMGVVYKAHQTSTDRDVAVKVMLSELFASKSAQERFQREIRLAARFQHPGIVRILEGGETSTGQPYFSMDLVEGVLLNRWVSVSRPDIRTILELFQEICDAIDYAHRHNVVHRDLTPRNVLVDDEGRPHILDFGLSKAIDVVDTDETSIVGMSTPGDIMGTLPYLSPEQAAGTPGEIDPRTDVYALGVMLFEALTGSHPYDCSGTREEYARRIREVPPKRPSSVSNQLNAELDAIILKALEKDRNERYQSVKDLGENLGKYLRGDPVYPQPPIRAYGFRKRLAKHRVGYGVTAVALLLAAGALFALLQASRQKLLEARHQALAIRRDWEQNPEDISRLLERATNLLSRYPRLPDVRLAYACLRFAVGRQNDDPHMVADACARLRDGWERTPSQGAYVALWDEICRRVQEYDLSMCEDRPDPSNYPASDTAEAHYVYSFATLDFSQATRHAELAISLDDGHSLAWRRLFYTHLFTKDWELAIEAALKLTALTRDPWRWLIAQARILTRQHKFWSAAERCDEALEVSGSPFNQCGLGADSYRSCALAHLCLRRYDDAIVLYDNAVRDLERIAGSEFASWPRYSRATVRWILGDLEGAAEDYRSFLRVESHLHANARLFLVLHDQARSFRDRHEEAKARQAEEQAAECLRTGRTAAAPGSWMGTILDCLAHEISADALVNAADVGDPEQRCEGFYYAGEACLLRGEQEEAREWFQNCVDTNLLLDLDKWPPDPMNEYHLAVWRLDSLSSNNQVVSPDNLEAAALHSQDR